jgi:hypothetical protein
MPWIDIDMDSRGKTVEGWKFKVEGGEIREKQLKTEGLRLEFFADAWEVPPPRVFFVWVADKGLRLDAASRASRKEKRLRVESLKSKGEGFGELNAEIESSG